MKISVIGVPTNSAGKTNGVARGPAAYRQAGLLEALQRVADVRDDGDVRFAAPQPQRDNKTGIIAPETMVDMIYSVDSAVSKAFEDSRFPLVLGGDCPLLLGCLSAARRRYGPSGLLFVDGHEDAYPPHESTTGEAADMELGLALGQHLDALPSALANLLPLLGVNDIALLGVRDAPVVEAEGVMSLRQSLPVLMFDDQTVLNGDVTAITRTALTHIGADYRHWWLHTDLDVLSTEALAAVDYQQPGGLHWEILTEITVLALRTRNIVGWDITIYNPDMDSGRQQARQIVEYVEAVLKRTAD